jgi:cytochrome c-type biogenesis protein CcmH/NrfG
MLYFIIFISFALGMLITLYYMVHSSKTKLHWYLVVIFVSIAIYYLAGNPRLLVAYYTPENIMLRMRSKQLQPLNNEIQHDLVASLLLIDENRANIEAWWSVAKIYELQHQYSLAQDAYYNLMNLEPGNELFFKQFTKMMLKDTKGVLSIDIRHKLIDLVAKKEDLTYLNLLAIDAYNTEHLDAAIIYWQRMYNEAKANNIDNETLIDINKLIDACKKVKKKLI